MLSEANVRHDHAASESEGGAKATLRRRTFLKSLGVMAAGVTVLSQTAESLAANGWNAGALDQLSNDQLIDMYTKMLKSRWWEELLKDAWLSGNDDLYGYVHLSIGQEAVSIGAIAALNEDDYIASTHRGHAQLIAKGGDLNKMSAEIWFRSTGYNQGFGGSMHITDMSKGILGMNGIVGSSHILAAGAAYGIKVRGTDQVSVAFGGDGSTNNGWFTDALRNAALYKLPLIIVVENNGWQVSNPTENTTPLKDIASFAKGYEVPGYVVDGQDALAMYSVMKAAVDRARNGEGPTLIEAKTYRFYDHAQFAGAKVGEFGAFGLPYRSDKDVHAWIANDPIEKFRNTIIAVGAITSDEADEIVEQVKAEVLESFEFARNSPHPAEDAGLSHVYAEGKVAASQFAA